MADYAIVIAEDDDGLTAIANKYNLTLIGGTKVSFDSLTTYTSPGFTKANYIDTGKPGMYALAKAP